VPQVPPKTKRQIVWDYCTRPWSWCCGNHLSIDDKENRNQVGGLITLLLFIIGGQAGAVWLDQRQGVRPTHLLFYLIVQVCLTGVVICINRSSKKAPRGCYRYAYDGATKMTGKCVFLCAVVIVLFSLIGFGGLWPKQAKLFPRVTDAKVLKDAPSPVPGLELFVPLVRDHFPVRFLRSFDWRRTSTEPSQVNGAS